MILFFCLSLANSEEPSQQQNQLLLAEFGSSSVYEQVQELQRLSPPFSPADRRLLWQIYFRARLGVTAEDPDVFERTLTLLILDYQDNPDNQMAADIISPLYASTLLHLQNQWSERYPQLNNTEFLNAPLEDNIRQELEQLIDKEWSVHGETWLLSFKTENGSQSITLFRWLLKQLLPAWRESISIQFAAELESNWGLDTMPIELSPPVQQPGQTNAPSPQRPDVSLQQFSPSAKPNWKWLSILGMIGLVVRYRRTKAGNILFGLLSLLLLENICTLFIKPLIETSSYFNFHHWQIAPWEDKGTYLETQGSYIRAQRFTREKQRQRIIILGASSAHGSNHLWEDSWAGILAKETDAEVINLAVGGTTSHGILHLLPYTLALDPDLIILYYGHNEVHQFQQLPEFQQSSVPALWMKNVLWRSSIYSLLYRIIPSTTRKPTRNADENTLDNSRQSQLVQLSVWNHKQNISLLLSAYQEAQIPVALLNPPTNYPFAPVDEQFQNIQVSTIAEKQHQIDCSLQATTIHSAIRKNNLELAQDYGLYYLDLDLYFHQESPDHFSANGLFWDELHPSALGQRWIAAPLVSFFNTERNTE